MNDNKFVKIFTLVGFVAFAAVSCWATAESLHLLLPSWPSVFCWAITIGFFFIASWGTKMIADSLNQNVYMEKRGATLVGGVAIVLIFWLLCSMPTNTHTFFFRNLIDDKISSDITTTKGYLVQIKDNTNNNEQAKIKVTQLKNELEILLGELEAEIKNAANPGFGPKAEEIFRKFAKLLGVDKIEPLNVKANSPKERQNLCDAYRQKMYTLADSKARNIVQSILSPSEENLREVTLSLKNLQLINKSIDSGELDLTNAEDVQGIKDKLNIAYNIIKKNEQFVNFKNESDKEIYTCANPQTKVARLLSVYDVWVDFLTGKEGGLAFVFWIIISILVDVAAFIFFDIAFKKRDF